MYSGAILCQLLYALLLLLLLLLLLYALFMTMPCQPLLSAHLQHFCMGFLNSVLPNNTFNWSSTNGATRSVSLEFLSTCCTATHMTRTTVNNRCILGSLKTYYALRNRAIWRSWTAFMVVNLF